MKQLAGRFLPTPNPTHLYTDQQYELVGAYMLLTHAEIEACLEDLAWDLVSRCQRAYKNSGKVRLPLLALVAYYQGERVPPQESLLKPPKKPPPDLAKRVELAIEAHGDLIRHNNGVKESNLLRVLLPVGVHESDFPPGWLQDMNTFGSERGDWAHKSQRSVRQPPDPVQSQELVNRATAGLANVDSALIKLRPR